MDTATLQINSNLSIQINLEYNNHDLSYKYSNEEEWKTAHITFGAINQGDKEQFYFETDKREGFYLRQFVED